MADRHPYEPERSNRDRYEGEDRGLVARAGDEVRSWFGDEDARRRRLDDERHEHGGSRPRWDSETGYAPRREHATRESRWRDERDYEPRHASHDFDEEWRNRSSSRDYSGIGYGLSGGHRDDARVTPGGGGLEAGYLGYGRGEYVAPHARTNAVASRSDAPAEGGRDQRGEWWRVPGPYVGRGPRTYQRSDERIREEVNERLTAHGLIDATDIDCQVRDGVVTLAGYVETRGEKRAAESLAEDVSGVREVVNQLKLRSNVETETPPAAESGQSRTRS